MRESVALVTLDDGKANALGYELMEQLFAALDRAENESKAVVLAGRPGRFCAGFDLRTMMSGVEQAHKLVTRGADLYERLYGFGLPLVVACTGHALAGGALVLLCGDVRIGVSGAFKIGLNELAIGMPLPMLAQELARDRLDVRQLTAATLGAKIYDPEQAAEVGYLDRTVAPDSLLDEAIDEAKQLTALSSPAYKLTKEGLRGATIKRIRDTLAADMARLTPPVS